MMARTGRPPEHGMSHEPEHRAYRHMLERCYSPNSEGFQHWGGRGIAVCDEWRNDFQRFYADMGSCPEGHSLDRIDTDGDYSRENCRWADRVTQANNTRRNVKVEWAGQVLSIAQWSREVGLTYHCLYRRIVIKGEKFPDAARPLYQRLAA